MEFQWRYMFASSSGTSHIKKGCPCQDFCLCETVRDLNENEVFIGVASDGAGSALYSGFGARLICRTIMEEAKKFISDKNSTGDISREIVKGWLEVFLKRAEFQAKLRDTSCREFACTILCGIIGFNQGIFFQIGDGAIIISPARKVDAYDIVFWPSRGEYENTTYFATNRLYLHEFLLFEKINRTINEISIITDGLQRLALEYQSRKAFKPFFGPLFAYLRTDALSCQGKINQKLKLFLASERLSKRVDDDKTLIAAIRQVSREGQGGSL